MVEAGEVANQVLNKLNKTNGVNTESSDPMGIKQTGESLIEQAKNVSKLESNSVNNAAVGNAARKSAELVKGIETRLEEVKTELLSRHNEIGKLLIEYAQALVNLAAAKLQGVSVLGNSK
jgi:hypothetical protein